MPERKVIFFCNVCIFNILQSNIIMVLEKRKTHNSFKVKKNGMEWLKPARTSDRPLKRMDLV